MRSWVGSLASGALVLACGCGGGTAVGTGDSGQDMDGGVTADAPGDATPSDGGAVQCADYDKYKHVYFGDLHTHTSYSADAFGFATRNEPVDAWGFARGKPVQIAAAAPVPGPMAKIHRNLDFDAITDHSEWLAAAYACGVDATGKPLDPNQPFGGSGGACKPYAGAGNAGLGAIAAARQVITSECGSPQEDQGAACLATTQSAWQAEQQAANAAYMPCTFTSFIAFEWTNVDSTTGATLHKNVVFPGIEVPDHPFDSTDYTTATDLWSALDTWIAQDPKCQSGAPCGALTIPHNSNKSWGGAFVVPTTASGVDQMKRYQKLVEIHQHKGNSECFFDPDAGATEKECGFEHLTPGADGPLNAQNYVRTALENGIAAYADGGTDPLQLGIVGATDDHNGMPGSTAEYDWNGHTGQDDDYPVKRLKAGSADKNPGGLTGVWAEQNTRDSIFAALGRRETFATSGTFIQVRLYQTWSTTDFCTGAFPSNIIDGGGLPMGGTIQSGGGSPGQGPTLYVSAAKDTADLAQVDIIKGTVTGGKVVETVTSMPAPSPGSFCMKWQDPAFDPKAPTFYYARVLEVPTPRWSHYDCQKMPAAAGCQAGGTLDVDIQERAWTSPIWSLP
jgi:hypothetical protein